MKCSIPLSFLVAMSASAGLLPPMNGSPGDFAQRRAGAEVDASYRIGVTNEGLYRINCSTLQSAGLSNLVGSEVRIYCQTQEVAVYVSTPGAMSAGDFVLFYGQGYDGYYTTTNVYWLGTGGSGARMTERSVAPIGGATEVTSRFNIAVYKDDQLYRAFYRPTDTSLDHWFAALLTNTGESAFSIFTDNRVSGVSAIITVYLNGLTSAGTLDPDHQTQVAINGSVVGTIAYDGDTAWTGSVTFASSFLSNGWSTVAFRQMITVTNDRAYLKKFSIAYTRLLKPVGGALGFYARIGTNNYTVTGFATNTGFWAVDATDPTVPVLLTNYSVSAAAGRYAVRFGDITDTTNRYFLCAASNVTTVSSVGHADFRDLASTNRHADWIVICPYEFRRSAYRLLKYRFTNGLSVAVAPVTDIYNEFSYGIKDADAIKQFLGYAFHHWQGTPPKFVLLAGEGSYDPKNNLHLAGAVDLVPVHLGPTAYDWASLDGWFATVNGLDNLGDIALGRVAASSDTQFGYLVSKTIQHEGIPSSASWRKEAHLVADDQDVGDPDFSGASDTNAYAYLFANGFTCTKGYLDYGSPASVRSGITNRINAGVYAVSYFGHGSYDLWAVEDIFNTNDVMLLTNSVFPLFTMLTCRSGAFDDPTVECLAEALVERNGHGAVAAVAASALSIEAAAEVFANGFYEALVKPTQTRTVGGMMNAGLLKLWTVSPLSDELLFYEIFGDPALMMKPTP